MKNKYFILALGCLVVFGAAFWIMKGRVGAQPTTLDGAAVSTMEPSAPAAKPGAVASDRELLIKEHSPILGPFSTPVTIVEFLDPECEACSAMYPIVKKVMAEFPNQIKLVIRYMPFHGNSLFAANALEEARAQGKYWEALELMFKRQPEWASHHEPKPEQIFTILSELKLKTAELQSAAKNGKYTSQIKQDENDGHKLGVRATPTFFINGKMLIEIGEAPLRAAIAAEMGK